MDAESAEKFNCEECIELREITPLLVFSAFSANPLRSPRSKAFAFAGEKELLSAGRLRTGAELPRRGYHPVTLVIFRLITHASHNVALMLRWRTLLLLLCTCAA